MKKEKGFTYEVTLDNNKKYIGAKVGTPDEHPNYYGSSKKDSEYYQDLKNIGVKNKIIIFEGTKQQAFNKERELLLAVDARNNPMYYNQTNGGGIWAKSSNYKKVLQLYKKIKNFAFKVQMTEKSKLANYVRIQIRPENIDSKKVSNICDQMHEDVKQYGYLPSSTKEKESYIVHSLEDYQNLGGLINGNHTLDAAIKCSIVKDVPEMIIPYSEWEDFSEEDLNMLGGLLNPKNTFYKDESGDDFWIQHIISKKRENNIDIRSDENKQILKDAGYTPYQMDRKIFRNIEKNEKEEELTPNGMQSINLESKSQIEFMEKTVSEENESPHIIATSIPSGNYTQDRVLDDLEPLEKAKLEKGHEISMVVIWMKHRTHTHYVAWNDGLNDNPPLLLERKRRLQRFFNKEKYTIIFKDFEHLQDKF